MRDRRCVICGEMIQSRDIEMRLSNLLYENTSMRKVDLHPECFDAMWSEVTSRVKMKGESCEDR